MSILARRIRATPERTASNAWATIVDLIAPAASEGRNELLRVSGLASSVIATESPANAPIVVRGKGPRLRFYCLYGEDAIAGHDADESRLAECPTAGDWRLSLPVEADDVQWLEEALAPKSARVTVRVKTASDPFGAEDADDGNRPGATIDQEAFLKP